MRTIWMGREQVAAYGRDFLSRLLAPNFPRADIWCAITASGIDFARELHALLREVEPKYATEIELWTVGRNRHDEVIRLDVGKTEAKKFQNLSGRHVLILDSAIHSGETFCAVHSRVAEEKPASIVSYSLVVKKSSAFYPTFWACAVDDSDRAYFLLDQLPNNRLTTGHKPEHNPTPCSLRRLTAKDCVRPAMVSGLESIDRQTWHERFYSMETNEHGLATYICEVGSIIAGFVTVHMAPRNEFIIDELAVSQTFAGRGLGGVLLRFAETMARQMSSRKIRFWAIENKVSWYRDHGYSIVKDEPKVKCGTELFQPMQKDSLFRTYFDPGA